MSYEPRPGSTAHRVIAHLETLPHGAEVLTSTIAMALGMQANGIPTCMEGALAAGAVFRRKRDPHLRAPLYWSLVNHARANGHAPAASNTPEQGPQHVLKAEAARPDATDRGAPAYASPGGGPTGAGQPAAAGPAGMRIALWSDGQLVIDSGAPRGAVTYTADETRQIVAYLDKVLIARAAA